MDRTVLRDRSATYAADMPLLLATTVAGIYSVTIMANLQIWTTPWTVEP